jgi:hypothetical protein
LPAEANSLGPVALRFASSGPAETPVLCGVGPEGCFVFQCKAGEEAAFRCVRFSDEPDELRRAGSKREREATTLAEGEREADDGWSFPSLDAMQYASLRHVATTRNGREVTVAFDLTPLRLVVARFPLVATAGSPLWLEAHRFETPITAVTALEHPQLGGALVLATALDGKVVAHAGSVTHRVHSSVSPFPHAGPALALAATTSVVPNMLLVAVATHARIHFDVLRIKRRSSGHSSRLVTLERSPAPPVALPRTLGLAFHPDGTLVSLEVPFQALLRALPAPVERKRFGE